MVDFRDFKTLFSGSIRALRPWLDSATRLGQPNCPGSDQLGAYDRGRDGRLSGQGLGALWRHLLTPVEKGTSSAG